MHPTVHAVTTPDKPAYIMAGTGETVTYAQLEARSNQGAHLLRSLGLRRGDCIAILMDNNARFFEVVWAAQRAGLYYTCISNRLAPPEIAQFVYHNDPEKTAAAANKHGWTTLGDMGWVDESGFLYLTDRQSFMIISGGVNIYPQEIENALVLHPKVADVAVIGAPDDEMGEQVVAVVQPVEWDDAGPQLANELGAFLSGRISRLKQPRRYDFDPELPRHPNGKLLKRLVRDRYWSKVDG